MKQRSREPVQLEDIDTLRRTWSFDFRWDIDDSPLRPLP